MNKEIIMKVLNNKSITEEEINTFIIDYIKWKKGKEPTSEQLLGIKTLIGSGHFNLIYAFEQAALHLNLYVCRIINLKSQQIIKQYCYE